MENPYAISVIDAELLKIIEVKLNEFPHFMDGNRDVDEYLSFFNTLSDKEYLTHIGDAVRFTCMLHQCTSSIQVAEKVEQLNGELVARLQLHILYCHQNTGGSYQDHIDTNDLRSIAVDMAITAMPSNVQDITDDVINDKLGMTCVKFMRSEIFQN